MLVHHVKYTKSCQHYLNGKRFDVERESGYIGTVVAIDKDVVGWSQCCDEDRTFWYDADDVRLVDHNSEGAWRSELIPADKFNKDLGIVIAKGRALCGTKSKPTKDWAGILLCAAIEKMKLRSQHYFKVPPHEYQPLKTNLQGSVIYE